MSNKKLPYHTIPCNNDVPSIIELTFENLCIYDISLASCPIDMYCLLNFVNTLLCIICSVCIDSWWDNIRYLIK